MKKSPMMKFLVIVVLVFFILSTGLMFVLYLASPTTVLELEDQAVTQTGEVIQIDELLNTGSTAITGEINTQE